MNLALFGGSFDPPHSGHVGLMQAALENLDIDKLVVMVAYKNRLKADSRFDSKARFLWMKSIVAALDSKFPGRIICSDYEIRQGQPVPTIDTIDYLIQIYKPSRIFCIIGSDNLASLHEWVGFERLASLVEFVVARRGDFENLDSIKACGVRLRRLEFDNPISSSEIMQDLRANKAYLPPAARDAIYEEYCRLKDSKCSS